jgi:hypothetical protein
MLKFSRQAEEGLLRLLSKSPRLPNRVGSENAGPLGFQSFPQIPATPCKQ